LVSDRDSVTPHLKVQFEPLLPNGADEEDGAIAKKMHPRTTSVETPSGLSIVNQIVKDHDGVLSVRCISKR